MSKKKNKASSNVPLQSVSTNQMASSLTDIIDTSENTLLAFFQRYGAFILPIILLFIASILYKDFLFGKNVFLFKDIGSDSYNFDYPKLYQLADYWDKFGSPGWSFEQGLGQNMHPYWFDPFTFLLVLGGKEQVANNLIYVFLLELLLAGIFFYLFLRTLKIQGFLSVLGGFLYAFSGYMVLGTTWQMSVFGTEVVYTALLLFALEKFISEKKWYFIPIPIAMIAIHLPFYLYLYTILIVIYYTLRFNEIQQWNFGKWFIGLVTIGLISVLGVGIGAFMFGSNVFQMFESPRGSGEFAYTNQLLSQPILGLADSLQRSTHFMRLFSTNMIGNAETFRGWNNYMEAPMFYCGLLSLVAAPQVFYFGNKKSRIVYGILLGMCFWVMLFPYFRYTFWLFTGDYYRTLGLFTLLALLFLNLRAIQSIVEEKKMGVIVLLATILILLIILFGFAPNENINKSLQKTAAFLILLYAGILFLLSKKAWLSVGVVSLLVVCMSEMIFFSNNTTVNKRSKATKQEMNEVGSGFKDATLDAVAYLKKTDTSPFYRIEKEYASGTSIHASMNDAKAQGYYSSRTYQSFNQLNYVRFMRSVKLLNPRDETASRWIAGLIGSPLLQRLCGVKYYLSKTPNAFTAYRGMNMDSVAAFGEVRVLKLKDTLPLGVTFDSYISEDNFEKLDSVSRQAILLQAVAVNKTLQTKLKDFKEVKSVTLPPEGITLEALKNWTDKAKQDTLQIKEFSPNLIKGDIQMGISKILFLAIPHDKGWSATVDGKNVTIEKVDAGLMGILLDRGKHQIELKFEPPYVREGTYVSIFSILIWGAGIVFFSLRKKKEEKLSTKNR
ncbi:YfhO family protein [Emticicia sp. SJ17W-69]|uniref:YfhO family protein n=1 Tax=Emticicia sp. SJ17W-69 TaxID=3421657 RepID=UPI003EB81A5E